MGRIPVFLLFSAVFLHLLKQCCGGPGQAFQGLVSFCLECPQVASASPSQTYSPLTSKAMSAALSSTPLSAVLRFLSILFIDILGPILDWGARSHHTGTQEQE